MALLVATLAWKAGFGLGAFLCLAFAMDSGRRAFSQREYLTLAPYQDKYQTFYQLYQSQNWADAERASEELLRNDLPAKVKQGVLVGLTFSRLKQKKAELAWEALSQIAPESLSAEVLQELENLFFELDHNEPARKIAEARFSKTGNAGAAYNVACAHSRLRQIELAFTWLEKARDAGFDDKNQIREDPDLANLRNYPDWEKWK
jgi:hypothetical protein